MKTTPTHTAQRIELAGMLGDSYGTNDHRRPLVLLHGQSFDRRLWRPVLRELFDIDPGRRVVNLDLPGYGESCAQMPHTNGHLLDLLRQAVDQAGLTAPVIVGHSSSGGLALMYAAGHPSSGAIDIDAVSSDLEPFARNLQSLEPQIAGDALQQVWAGAVESFELHLLEPGVRAAVLANMELRPDTLRSYWNELIYGDAAELSGLLERVARGIAAAGVQVLLVAGRDPGPGMADLFGAAGAHLTVEAWPASGHFPHLAHPARFAQRLAATGAWPESR
jgi:pimeloyl-ACP methyl ester carboxylesterase